MSTSKAAILFAALMCVACGFWLSTARRPATPRLTYTRFLEEVRAGRVASVVISEDGPGAVQAACTMKAGAATRAVLPSDYREALEEMQNQAVEVEIRDPSAEPLRLARNAAPFLLLLGIWLFLALRKFPKFPKTALFG